MLVSLLPANLHIRVSYFLCPILALLRKINNSSKSEPQIHVNQIKLLLKYLRRYFWSGLFSIKPKKKMSGTIVLVIFF